MIKNVIKSKDVFKGHFRPFFKLQFSIDKLLSKTEIRDWEPTGLELGHIYFFPLFWLHWLSFNFVLGVLIMGAFDLWSLAYSFNA